MAVQLVQLAVWLVEKLFNTLLMLIGLAPLHGITDIYIRLWFYLIGGFDFVITPFIRANKNLTYNRLNKNDLVDFDKISSFAYINKIKVIPQLLGSNIEEITQLAEQILKNSLSDFVDINCACPSKTVIKHGGGSFWLKNMKEFNNLLNSLEFNLGKNKYSLKIRTGINTHNEFDDILNIIKQYLPYLLIVHPRLVKDMYNGEANWQLIDKTLQTLNINICASGDIINYTTFIYKTKYLLNNLHSVIIGRGAILDPFIFHKIKQQTDIVTNYKIVIKSLEVLSLLTNLLHFDFYLLNKLIENKFFTECALNLEQWIIKENILLSLLSNIKNNNKFALNKLKIFCHYFRFHPIFQKLLQTQNTNEFFILLHETKTMMS